MDQASSMYDFSLHDSVGSLSRQYFTSLTTCNESVDRLVFFGGRLDLSFRVGRNPCLACDRYPQWAVRRRS